MGAGRSAQNASQKKQLLFIALGMIFYWPCLNISRNDFFIFQQTETNSDIYSTLLLYLAILLVLGLLCFFKREALENALAHKRWLPLVLSVGASLGILLYLLPRNENSQIYWSIRIASSILLLSWYLIMTFAWGKAVTQLGSREGTLLPIATFIASIGITLFYFLPFPISEIIQVVTPLVSGLFWFFTPSGDNQESFSSSLSRLQNAPLQTFIMCGIFYCAAGTMRDFISYNNYETANDYTGWTFMVVSLLTTGALLLTLSGKSRTKETNRAFIAAWSVAAVIFIGCLILVALGITPQAKGGESILSSCYMCFKLLLWLFATIVARNSKVSVVTVFSLFYMSFAALMLFGASIITPALFHMSPSLSSYVPEIMLFTAFILIASIVFFFVHYEPLGGSLIVSSEKETSRYEAIESLANQHNLTARESEVTLLIARGYSVKKIAEVLYISQETVRTHSKKIYRKLDLHTKQDIIDLLNTR